MSTGSWDAVTGSGANSRHRYRLCLCLEPDDSFLGNLRDYMTLRCNAPAFLEIGRRGVVAHFTDPLDKEEFAIVWKEIIHPHAPKEKRKG